MLFLLLLFEILWYTDLGYCGFFCAETAGIAEFAGILQLMAYL